MLLVLAICNHIISILLLQQQNQKSHQQHRSRHRHYHVESELELDELRLVGEKSQLKTYLAHMYFLRSMLATNGPVARNVGASLSESHIGVWHAR